MLCNGRDKINKVSMQDWVIAMAFFWKLIFGLLWLCWVFQKPKDVHFQTSHTNSGGNSESKCPDIAYPTLVHRLGICQRDYSDHVISAPVIKRKKSEPRRNFESELKNLGDGVLPCLCHPLLCSFVWPASHDLLQTTQHHTGTNTKHMHKKRMIMFQPSTLKAILLCQQTMTDV